MDRRGKRLNVGMRDKSINIWYTVAMDMYEFKQNNKLSYGRGYVYSLQYHIVWCTKYRRKVLSDGIDLECKDLLTGIAEEYGFEILAMEVMPDHIHLLLDVRREIWNSCRRITERCWNRRKTETLEADVRKGGAGCAHG